MTENHSDGPSTKRSLTFDADQKVGNFMVEFKTADLKSPVTVHSFRVKTVKPSSTISMSLADPVGVHPPVWLDSVASQMAEQECNVMDFCSAMTLVAPLSRPPPSPSWKQINPVNLDKVARIDYEPTGLRYMDAYSDHIKMVNETKIKLTNDYQRKLLKLWRELLKDPGEDPYAKSVIEYKHLQELAVKTGMPIITSCQSAKLDLRYPTINGCPLCGSSAYIGLNAVECSSLTCANHR